MLSKIVSRPLSSGLGFRCRAPASLLSRSAQFSSLASSVVDLETNIRHNDKTDTSQSLDVYLKAGQEVVTSSGCLIRKKEGVEDATHKSMSVKHNSLYSNRAHIDTFAASSRSLLTLGYHDPKAPCFVTELKTGDSIYCKPSALLCGSDRLDIGYELAPSISDSALTML